MLSGLLKFGSMLVKPIANIARRRQKLSQSTAHATAKWEAKAMQASISSWKDEFWTIVVGSPIILRMFGVLLDLILAPWGIKSGLSEAAWQMMLDVNEMLGGNYHVVVMMCVSSSFGIRVVPKLKGTGVVQAIADKIKVKSKPKRVMSANDWK